MHATLSFRMSAADIDQIVSALGAYRPAPWMLWLVVCLCRQRARQTWLMEVADRLSGDDGDVPDSPGWQAWHHGTGLCLCGPDGEIIDMDFVDDSPRSIDPYFFAHRVRSTPQEPETELRRWLPGDALVVAGIDELRREGVLRHPASHHIFRLADALEAVHARVARVDSESLARCRALASFESDEPGGTRHSEWLCRLLDDRRRSPAVESVASILSRAQLAELARRHVGPADSMSASLLDACTERGVDARDEAVRLRDVLDPAAHHPFIACAVGRHLLGRTDEHAPTMALVRRFAAVRRVAGYQGNPLLDQLAFLLLEHEPGEALPVIRRALRAAPACAASMAELLAAIDEAWCHRELESVLRDERAEASNQRRAARALLASSSELARRAARKLAPAPPQRSGQVGFSFDEVDHTHLAQEPFVISERAQALAVRLRGRPAPK